MNKSIIILLLINIGLTTLSQNIGLTSIPKCGTFLLVKCIELLKNEKGRNIDGTDLRNINNITNNKFFYCHLSYTKEFEQKLKNDNFKIFFIYRDPRDQIVSHAFWIKKIYPHYKNYTIDQLITLMIKSINHLYPKYLQWLTSDIACPVKFENLIGQKGGGNDELQMDEINKICNHLGIKSKESKENCIKNLFGNSPTFREGKTGSWKEYFSNEQIALFKKVAGNLLLELDYEKDNNW